MNTYEKYQAALKALVEVRNKHDFSAEGEAEFDRQVKEVKRLYRLACLEGAA